ncbi:cell division topological specificity factor MinE [Alkalibaculum bacchi]|uniref:cell division topological specificity factor MinE n=1 Tax=Alkalibaculum bacchi TaxID=645887 RepID=UPI0026F0FE41|nr:cell division topological specificity factor MinE [Alkalibaculum bacchi]
MLFFRGKQDSKDIAKRRLQSLLSNEKNNMNTEKLDMIKSEIIHSVEDHFPVNRSSSEIYITEENKESAIVVILPIVKEKV